MIRHCVFVKFKSSVDAAEQQSIFAQLDALRQTIPGMLSFKAGPNVSPEGLNQGFGHGIIIDFRDVAARDAYLADADHAAAGGRMVAALEGGRDGLLVIDLEM